MSREGAPWQPFHLHRWKEMQILRNNCQSVISLSGRIWLYIQKYGIYSSRNVPEEGWICWGSDQMDQRTDSLWCWRKWRAKGEDGRMTVQVSSGMSSKQTTVLPVGGRGAAGFSKFLFTPLFGSRQWSSAFSALWLGFLLAPPLGSLLFDEPLDLGPQGLQILLLNRVKTCCVFHCVEKRLSILSDWISACNSPLVCFYIASCPLPTVFLAARKYSHRIYRLLLHQLWREKTIASCLGFFPQSEYLLIRSPNNSVHL